MKKVAVIGHYAVGLEYFDGQTVKTKILTKELCKQLGENEILQFDTHGGVKALIKAPFQVWQAFRKAKNIIMLPANNGLRVFGRLLAWGKRFFKSRKIHYIVIGGWLPDFLKTKNSLARSLKSFDGIYVETNIMKQKLEKQGFSNVSVMPNCKDLKVLTGENLVYAKTGPYKLCTFSRVMKEKGIEDAVNAVKAVNEQFGKVACTLDIYGQIDENQSGWFNALQNGFPDFIRYCGVVPYDKSDEILKSYFALLFPTYYDGEGFAGTLIDALAAGVPIIASDWKYNGEIVTPDVGLLYRARAFDELVGAINISISNVDATFSKKPNCLHKALLFSSEKVVSDFIKNNL